MRTWPRPGDPPAIFIPLSRWLADRIGARRLFFLAVLLFTVASALCAASTGLTMLTLTRVLQGIGGAMMGPVGRLVVPRLPYADVPGS